MHSVEEVLKIEPALSVLFRQIPAIMQREATFDRGWVAIKWQFSHMVGMWAQKRILASAEDYDLIYRHFLVEAERFDR